MRAPETPEGTRGNGQGPRRRFGSGKGANDGACWGERRSGDMASRSSRPRGRLLCALAGDFPREGNNAAISLARMLSGPEAEPDRRRAGGMIIQWRRRRSPGRETCGPRPGPFSGTASSGAAGGARSRPRAARPGPRRRTRPRWRGRAPRTTSSSSSGARTTPTGRAARRGRPPSASISKGLG